MFWQQYICEEEVLLDAKVAESMAACSRIGPAKVILADETQKVGVRDLDVHDIDYKRDGG